MNDKQPSAREKIAKLRARFLEQLPGRVVEVRKLFERLRSDPTDKAAAVDLHRALHSLKGTGRSFGFTDLGATAGFSEDLMAELLDMPDKPAPENWQERLGKYLEYIEMATAVACSLGSETCGRAEAAFSLPVNTSERDDSDGCVVYLCDDEELTLEQLSTQLSCFGYVTRIFTDPQAFHDAVIERRPAAAIMDIHFPQGHNAGTDIMAQLAKEIGKAVPAIFVSSRDDFAARLAAVQAGGEAYFVKPVCAMDLMPVLDALTCQDSPDPFRILIVDDEPEIAAYHAILLQEAGMITREVCEPERLLETLNEFLPDMVLMDMYMPTCNGRDLARVIRQLPDYVGLPIVFLSSETDRHKQFSAMRVGAEGFLTKPIEPEHLIAAVSIRAERMRTLRSLLARDSLTGLLNHTTTTQFLENALSTARRNDSSLCFAMIDIDRFKSVNDTYGHPAGDQVILALSRILQQRLRNSDVVGRYGGEEFAVILPGVSLDRATKLIDELREDFSRVSFQTGDVDFSCTFSAGIASYDAHQQLGHLREAADKALYEAKRSGRNRIVVDSSRQSAEEHS